MGKPHIIAIPYPAQGHVIPLLELMQSLVKQDFKITFVNSEFNHKRVMNALSEEDRVGNCINFVSISDGLEPWEDRNDLGILTEGMLRVMPGELEELIHKINQSGEDNVTCVVADENMGWALEVAENMQIKRAAFWPAASAMLAFLFSIDKMMDDGIIDFKGTPKKDNMIQLSPTIPSISTHHLPWVCIGNFNAQVKVFQHISDNNRIMKAGDYWLICNSYYELEPAAFSLIPNMLPIGPLLASNRLGKTTGNFWPEDSTCLEWLDQQPAHSVIYVAFGSFTVFDNTQFKELALGLELINRPFLWVVRPDITGDMDDAYPKGFKERVADRARIVNWVPQQAVLSHPSVACFFSHCGWNSTMEGVSNGVPFLCWPYFADQIFNQSYICDIWKIGLGFEKDEDGIIQKEEIKSKVEYLLTEKRFKERALDLKKIAADNVKEGGQSNKNLKDFIEWIKK